MAQFAYPFSSLVMSNLLGLGAEHHQTFRDVSAAIAKSPAAVLHGDFSEVVRIAVCLRQAELLLEELMLQRRAAPTADLISRLANEGDVNSRLSDDEIIVLCNFLLTLGHEITFNLLAGSVCHLLSERHLWDQLLEHPKILANATEELLRFISPILWIPRKMTKDTELDGHILRKGSRVYLGIGAANHDRSQFTNPDTLDLTRSKPHSLAFGYGLHFSVGLAFAKLETKLALSSLLHNMPDITLGSRVFDYRPIHFLRALKTLQVSGKVG